jgi:hypothetical protein
MDSCTHINSSDNDSDDETGVINKTSISSIYLISSHFVSSHLISSILSIYLSMIPMTSPKKKSFNTIVQFVETL